MRVVWKGQISFGLVNIPIALYTATKSDKLSFKMVDRRDRAPVGYQKVNKKTGEELDSGDIARAYELDSGELVLMEKEDFDRADPKRSKTVEILDFVEEASIEPMFFEKPYYLSPDKAGGRSYALLREVIRDTGRVAVAKVVLRKRENLAVLYVRHGRLVLNLLRFAEELREPEVVEAPADDLEEHGISKRELEMAHTLVEGLSTEWEPERYTDEYQDKLLAVIRARAEGGDVHAAAEAEAEGGGAEIVDLTERLRQSVEQVVGQKGGEKSTPTKKSTSKKTASKGTSATKKAPSKKADAKKSPKKSAKKKDASEKESA